MSVKSEEIKVVISASAGELKRELTAAEREMMKARGVMEQEGGRIAASSKVWSQYRNKTASELQKTLSDVERTQDKINKLLEKGPAIRESEMSAYEAKLASKGYSGETAAKMTMEAASRGDQLQGLQSILAAQQASVQELTGSLSALNAKVAETTQTEEQEAQAARDAAEAEKEHTRATSSGTSAAGSFLAALKKRVAGLLQFSHAARSAGQSASSVGRGGQTAGSGIARIGRTAILALIGVRSLYAGLRKLISATANAAAHNRTLANSLGQIKGNLSVMFQSIFQAALPALKTLASWLATVTSYVAQFTAMLFGVKWKTAVDGAKAASSGIGGVADNAKKASKAIHQMGIDELNILDREDDSDSSGGGGAGGIASVYSAPEDIRFEWLDRLKEKLMPLIEKVKAAMEKIKELFEAIRDSFINAWQTYGESIINEVITLLGTVIDNLGTIAEKIKEAWTNNGVGDSIFANILQAVLDILGALNTTAEAMSNWLSSTTFFSDVAEAFAAITGTVETVLSSLKTSWDTYAGPIIEKLGGTLESIATSIGNITLKIREAWQNADAGTRIFEGLLSTVDSVLGIVSDVSEAFKEWTENADLTEVLQSITRLWESISDLANQIRNDFQPAWGELVSSLGDSALQTVTNLVNALATAFEKIKTALATEGRGEALGENLSKILGGLAGIAAGLSDTLGYIVERIDFDQIVTAMVSISGSVAAVVASIKEMVDSQGFKDLMAFLVSETLSAASGIITAISVTLDLIATSITTITALLNGDFAAAWNGFKIILYNLAAIIINLFASLVDFLADKLPGFLGGKALSGFAEDLRGSLADLQDLMFPVEAEVTDVKPSPHSSSSAFSLPVAAEVREIVEQPGDQLILPVIVQPTDFDLSMFGITENTLDLSMFGLDSVEVDVNADATPFLTTAEGAVESVPSEIEITINGKLGDWPSIPTVPGAAGGGIIHAARGGIIPRLASGGSLGLGGQLFIAREAGPELVAGIGGGRTAVMNNDQIVKSVSDGVYKAVREAMAGGSFDVNVLTKVICDNREIAKAAEKGRASLGRQIGSRAFA